jgi:hypothetical protein
VGKFYSNSPIRAGGVDTLSVLIITCPKTITAPGITIMITSSIIDTAEIAGVNYQECPINVNGAEWSFVIIAGYRRIIIALIHPQISFLFLQMHLNLNAIKHRCIFLKE